MKAIHHFAENDICITASGVFPVISVLINLIHIVQQAMETFTNVLACFFFSLHVYKS